MPRSVEKAEDMEDKTCQSLGPNGRGLLWFLLLPLLLLLLLMLLLLLLFFLRKTERSLPVKWHDEVVEPVPESAAPLFFSLGLPGAGPA